jgi:hypothetical protein
VQPHNLIDLTGQRFEHLGLTVLGKGKVKQKVLWWRCLRDDGLEVERTGYQLRTYRPRPKRPPKPKAPKKSCPKAPEKSAWRNMIRRCAGDHPDYGGRGIRVDPVWQASYETFLADVGPRPGSGYSLERKLVDGHYEPGNVIWATRKQQSRNKRSNRLLTHEGLTLTVAEWAERTGLTHGAIRNRLGMRLPVAEVLRPGRKPLVRSSRTNRPQQRHGLSGTPEHTAWSSMVQRCTQDTHSAWERYGGRGIIVCERWLDFLTFLSDLGPRPSPQHSLERLRVNEDYEPGNCCWATRTVQARNTRRARMLTLGDETLCLAAWAERLGVKSETIRSRLRMGWTEERALTFVAESE